MARNEPIHTHEVKNFLSCRLLWFWTAPQPRGMNLEPNRPTVPLDIGSLTHGALQEFYDRGTEPDVAFAREAVKKRIALEKTGAWHEEVEELTENTETLCQVLRTYARWSQRHDKNIRFIATETPWRVKYGGIPFAGRLDALVERPDGLWVLDFKTTSWTSTDWTEQDLQATMYVMAARKLYGERVQGMVFRFLRKKVPYDYNQLILKKGGVTRRKGLAELTTLDNYMLALAILALEQIVPGLEPVEYEAMLMASDRKEKSWYPEFKEAYTTAQKFYWKEINELKGVNGFIWEVEERRTQAQIDNYMKYVVVPAAREMRSRRKGRWIGPTGLGNAWANCRRCRFKLPCEAVMSGASFKTLLATQYHQRQRDEGRWE